MFDPSASGFSEKYASSLLSDKLHESFKTALTKKGISDVNTEEITSNINIKELKLSEIFVVIVFDLSDSQDHVTKLELPGVRMKKEGSTFIGLWITLGALAALLIIVFIVLKVKKKQSYGNINLPTDEMKLVDDDKDSTIN